MKKIAVILFLSIMLLAFSSCNPADSSSNGIDHTTSELPGDDSEILNDGFDGVRRSDELWLSYGLDAYLLGKETPDLKDFFAEPANISYMTLYADMFFYDWASSVPVAEALFRFIADEYGKEALTDINRRIEYKSAFLASLGLDIPYTQDPEVEALLSRMTVSSEKDWKYVVSIDNATYYLNDFSQGGIAQYHSLFYYNTSDLAALIDYVEETLPEQELDTNRHFEYYLTFDGTNASYTSVANGKMYINDSYSTLHESLHAMGLHSVTMDHYWLSEGLCNYLGKLSGLATQYKVGTYQIMSMAASGAFDSRAEAGDLSAVFYQNLYHAYVAAGGSMTSVSDFDLVLHNDLWAALERDIVGSNFTTIGDAYKMINGQNTGAIGLELSYPEATSFVAYLVELYGMDTVLLAYNAQDLNIAFGKTYEELKAMWQASLSLSVH